MTPPVPTLNLQKVDPLTTQPSRNNAVIVQSKSGTKYEKAIDWSNFQTCWIDTDGNPILHQFLHRYDHVDKDGQIELFS